MSLSDYETNVRSCFGSVAKLWYEDGAMMVAIAEDHNWWKNSCVLQDWFFNYDSFKKMPLQIDCERYGVYKICLLDEEDDECLCCQNTMSPDCNNDCSFFCVGCKSVLKKSLRAHYDDDGEVCITCKGSEN